MNKEFAKKIKNLIHRKTFGANSSEDYERGLIEAAKYISAYVDGVLDKE